jgi:hypothetical protein
VFLERCTLIEVRHHCLPASLFRSALPDSHVLDHAPEVRTGKNLSIKLPPFSLVLGIGTAQILAPNRKSRSWKSGERRAYRPLFRSTATALRISVRAPGYRYFRRDLAQHRDLGRGVPDAVIARAQAPHHGLKHLAKGLSLYRTPHAAAAHRRT